MLPEKIIYLYSVQHTGTRFAASFLKQHSNVCKLLPAHDIAFDNEIFQHPERPGKIVFTAHVWGPVGKSPAAPYTNDSLNRLFKVPDLEKYYQRFLGPFYTSPKERKHLVPIRDPLLSLITGHVRQPERDNSDLIYGFQTLPHLPNSFFIPVDLTLPVKQRENLLTDALGHVGLEKENYVKFIADSWPIVGSFPTTETFRLRICYIQRDTKMLEKTINEYQLLKKQEPILRPFLENIGYRNLLWWD